LKRTLATHDPTTCDRMVGVPLDWRELRPLTVPAAVHPRGQPHLSAASGLVCAFDRVYVVADDEHHLGLFDDALAPGRLHRVAAGDLPREAGARKRRKADLETLMWVPRAGGASEVAGCASRTAGGTSRVAGGASQVAGSASSVARRAPTGADRASLVGSAFAGDGGALWLLGSGSTPARDRAFVQPLDGAGEPCGDAQAVDLAPLYEPLRARLGALNIEGALVQPGQGLWLFNRGGSGERGRNVIAHYAGPRVLAWLHARRGRAGRAAVALAPTSLREVPLGAVQGVGYGFTDAAALPASLGGGCLFTAVAEDSADSVADGACVGSALGRLGPAGELRWLRPLRDAPKVEGLALHAGPHGLTLCLATDADDPQVASRLLLAHLPGRAVEGRLR